MVARSVFPAALAPSTSQPGVLLCALLRADFLLLRRQLGLFQAALFGAEEAGPLHVHVPVDTTGIRQAGNLGIGAFLGKVAPSPAASNATLAAAEAVLEVGCRISNELLL